MNLTQQEKLEALVGLLVLEIVFIIAFAMGSKIK